MNTKYPPLEETNTVLIEQLRLGWQKVQLRKRKRDAEKKVRNCKKTLVDTEKAKDDDNNNSNTREEDDEDYKKHLGI